MKCVAKFALAILIAFTLPGCDWIQYNFMNSIPFKGDPSHNPEVFVYLGVDGMAYHATQEAMKQGAFPGLKLSKFITAFPGTSDYSWTRMMHTEKMGGYEMEYYDPTTDSVHNRGLLGVAKHIMPSIAESLSFEEEYLKGFDYSANGYTHSLEAYRDTFVSLADTLDNLFYLLGGRSETTSVFSAYMLEIDVMGHMQTFDEAVKALKILSNRIEQFKAHHPERKFRFTILSDHGMDFIKVQHDKFVLFSQELERVGVRAVETLGNHDPKQEIYAVPIEHTRVTYLALHTHSDLIDEVASRASQIGSVDLAVAKLKTPLKDFHAPASVDWFALWSEGKIAAYFGFDPAANTYYLPSGYAYDRFGMTLTFDCGQDFKAIDDSALFKLAKNSTYPDLFYRVRTALSPVAIKYPADVLISFKPTWAEVGFKMPVGGDDIASAGFHGSLEKLGTLGTLLSDERELPGAVRADTFLELFPRMKQHLMSKKLELVDGDKNASLHYE